MSSIHSNRRIVALTATLVAALVAAPALAQDDGQDPDPEVPGVPELKSGIAKQAGTGGDIAFATAGVLELGGGGSFTVNDSGLVLGLAPSIGWFVINNFELSLIGTLTYVDNDQETDDSDLLTFGIFLEPSLHLPLTNRFLIFAGLGLGAAYTEEDIGFALRPRLGFDILIGRSGILRPSFDLTWSSSEVVNEAGTTFIGVQATYGFSFGYHVMF